MSPQKGEKTQTIKLYFWTRSHLIVNTYKSIVRIKAHKYQFKVKRGLRGRGIYKDLKRELIGSKGSGIKSATLHLLEQRGAIYKRSVT